MIELLAHAGGWDEILGFVVTIVLAIVAVSWSNRRFRRRAEEQEQEGEPPPSG